MNESGLWYVILPCTWSQTSEVVIETLGINGVHQWNEGTLDSIDRNMDIYELLNETPYPISKLNDPRTLMNEAHRYIRLRISLVRIDKTEPCDDEDA